MSQNYYSSEENAKSCFWTASVTGLVVYDLFSFIHFLCSVNYFHLRYVYWSICLTENLCFDRLGLRRPPKLHCRIRTECWAHHRWSAELETCLSIFPYWSQHAAPCAITVCPMELTRNCETVLMPCPLTHRSPGTGEKKITPQKLCNSETVHGHGYDEMFIPGFSLLDYLLWFVPLPSQNLSM